jgi:hypothetical protein
MPTTQSLETDFDLALVFGILAIVAFLIWKGAAIFSWFSDTIGSAVNAGVTATESAVGSVVSPPDFTPPMKQAEGTLTIDTIGTTLGLPGVP